MSGKALVHSKEFWLNAVSFILVILAMPEFISLIPTGALPYIALVNAVGNAAIRYIWTAEPITSIMPR